MSPRLLYQKSLMHITLKTDAPSSAELHGEEFATVRRATIQLFRPLNETECLRHGKANENDVSVRAVANILAGHELHHMGVLRSRYLQS